MKNSKIPQIFLFLFVLLVSTGMDIVGDIFEFGLWVGVILVVLVILVIVWIVRKFMG